MSFPAQMLADKLDAKSLEAGFCRCLTPAKEHSRDCPVQLMRDAAKMLRMLSVGRVK